MEKLNSKSDVLLYLDAAYSKIKKIENKLKISKKEVTIEDIKLLNLTLHKIDESFKAFQKNLYP